MPTPSPTRRYRSWLINLLLALAVVAGVQWWEARPLVRGVAPALAGSLLDGQAFALGPSGFSQGEAEPVLVLFWASWCPVCRLGQGTIDAIARDKPVITVAVRSGDAQDLRAYLREQGLSFPVLPDPDGSLASTWGVPGVPATFVVDSAGRIRFATAGHTTEAGLRARLWLAARMD
jgi:thiol-disulfide isomerase/thioredoxin